MTTLARRPLRSLLAIALGAVSLAACAAAAVQNRDAANTDKHAAMMHQQQETPKLYVRGSAELQKPADQLRISIGVVTEHAEPEQALRENTRRMSAVIDAIERVGLTEDEYQTGRFQIRPVYSQRPARHPSDQPWRPEIVAYSVTNTINIKTQQLQLAGQIIQAANRAGSNTIDSIQFTLADPRIHRAEAIAAATANARSDAQALADAAGVRLLRVLDVRLDDAMPIRPPQPMLGAERMMVMDAAVPPPISPGDVTVHASVNLVYEIAPAN